MSLISHIENLRAKPEHVRRRIAFWSSFGITAVIGMFWLGTFSTMTKTAQSSVATAVDKVESPAQSLVASVGDFVGDIRDLFLGPKKVEYNTLEVLPGRR